jgi:hypothetical protein
LVLIPKTRGKTIEEMDAASGSHCSREDTQELARIQSEIRLTALLYGSVTELFQIGEEELSTNIEETRCM